MIKTKKTHLNALMIGNYISLLKLHAFALVSLFIWINAMGITMTKIKENQQYLNFNENDNRWN